MATEKDCVRSDKIEVGSFAKFDPKYLASREVSELIDIAKEAGVAADEVKACYKRLKGDVKNNLLQLIAEHVGSFEQAAKRKSYVGKKTPPPHVMERQKEHRSMLKSASLRSDWATLEEDRWDSRHHIMYSNSRLHPNYRSYFDRRVLRREELEDLGIDHAGVLKPSWRLSTEGLDQEERQTKDKLLQSTGPCAKPLVGDTVALEQPSSFSVLGSIHDPNAPASDAVPSALKACGTRQPLNNPFVWSDRHQIVWCNERNTSGKKLNPVQLRCYFDRMRFPHTCRCEVPVKNVRVMPNWKLRTDPLTGNDMGGEQDPSVAEKANHGQFEKRESKWNTRHDLVFKNEEVSRLDRCYFDRWREPDANLHGPLDWKSSKSPEGRRKVRSLKPTWSLEKEGSPDRAAKIILSKTASRHEPCGKWNSRHQRFFLNDIHTNLKSYFDRPREPEEMSGAKKTKNSSLSEKLGVDWSLQEVGCIDYPPTLRSNSVPVLSKEGARKHNQKPSWFSSHGVTFLSKEEHSKIESDKKHGVEQYPPMKSPLPDCFRAAS